MAGTSFATLAAILMNDRTDKVIHNLLQTDTAFWGKLAVKGRSWSGDVCIIGLRVDRNKSVVAVSGNAEPPPGNQGFLRLTVGSKTVLARCQWDLMALLSAEDSKGSLGVEPMDDLENTLNDIAKKMCKYAFVGGGGQQFVSGVTAAGSPIGLIWQRVAAPAAHTYGYHGRFDDIATNLGAAQKVQFRRLDTYAQVGADTQLVSIGPDSITLLADIDTSALPKNVPCGVFIVGAASQAFVATTVTGDNIDTPCVTIAGGDPVAAFTTEPTGMISNLTQVIHFGQDRASADPLVKKLRSNFVIVNNTNAQGGDNVSTGTLNKLYAKIRQASGKRPNESWISWDTAVAVGEIFTGVQDVNLRVNPAGDTKAFNGTADQPSDEDNYTGYAPGKIKIMASDLMPSGMVLTLRLDGIERLFRGPQEGMWMCSEGPGKGNPMTKLQGETQWGSTRALVSEQVCTEPLAQGIIIGIAPPAA